MKKIAYWLMPFALGSLALCTVSCSDDDEGENPPPEKVEITVNPASIADFAAIGGTQTFTVTTKPADAAWDAVPAEKWAVVTKSGNKFTVTVGENTDAERTNSITVSAEKATPVVMNFKQAAPVPVENTLEISGSFDFPAAGGEQILTITSNTSWTITTTYNEGDGWLAYSAESGTGDAAVTVTAARNTPSPRSAVIKVQAADDATLFKTVDVTQAPAEESALFIDELVGDWTYSGVFMQLNNATKEWSAYDDPHKLVVSKIDDNTIKIDNIVTLPSSEIAYHNAIRATVDNANKTVSIVQQVFFGGTESWDEDGWDVYFTPFTKEVVDGYHELWNSSFDAVPVTGQKGSYVIDLKSQGVLWGNIAGVPANSTFLPLTVVPGGQPTAETVYWYSQEMVDVVLTQGYTEPAPAPQRIGKPAVMAESYRKTLERMHARLSK